MSRHVTVASVSANPSCSPTTDLDKSMEEARRYARRAHLMGADILAFPEMYAQAAIPHSNYAELVEDFPGQTTELMRAEARKLGMYLIWPLFAREDGVAYNSAILIDRQGEIAGVYHKMFPTIGEIEQGIMPGADTPVFATDFGTIGMAICYDLNFREIMTALKENGAEIIFFCSAYRGGQQVRAWALELGCYLVSAILNDLGQIVDLTGRQLVESYFHQPVITCDLNLNRQLLHMDYNYDKMDAMLEKYGADLTFDYASPEARYALGCERPGLSIEQVIDEFGLERHADYFQRAREVRRVALAARD